jgi:hypothetical protein
MAGPLAVDQPEVVAAVRRRTTRTLAERGRTRESILTWCVRTTIV